MLSKLSSARSLPSCFWTVQLKQRLDAISLLTWSEYVDHIDFGYEVWREELHGIDMVVVYRIGLGGLVCGISLQWRHNGRDGVSNHQPHDCLLNRLSRCRSEKTSKLHVTGLCAGNSPVTGEFSAQKASNAEMFPFDDVIMLERHRV